MIHVQKWLLVAVLTAGGILGHAQDLGDGLGIRGGLGTDISFGGLAGGVGVNLLVLDNMEAGLIFYYGKFSETSNNGFNTYEETTQITALAVLANYLYGYTFGQKGTYFVAGFGLAYLGIYWEESSKTDTTLGPLLPGGGSMQDWEASVGGMMLNIGAGYSFGRAVDIRFEVPVVIAFGETGGGAGVIPLFTLTAGYRFGL